MATTPVSIRFDDDLYSEMKAIAKRPFTASWHIQEACREYLEQHGKPVVLTNNKPLIEKVDNDQFEGIWVAYGKKGNKKTSRAKFNKLSISDKHAIYDHIPIYVQSTPDKQYRKNFETYINQEAWNDEVNNNEINNRPNEQRKLSVVERTRAANAERERARQARAGNGSAMGEATGNLRPPVEQPVRGDNTGELGAVIDGDYTRTD